MVEILLRCRYNKNDIKKGDVVMRAHTVILGAGATMAAIPNGDKNGKKSSVMNGMISKLKNLKKDYMITLILLKFQILLQCMIF